MQSASMASITTSENPLETIVVENTSTGIKRLKPNTFETNDTDSKPWDVYRVVNASAVEYSDEWAAQCECNLPRMKYVDGKLDFDYGYTEPVPDPSNMPTTLIPEILPYNPYRYNVKGVWRAKKSYAYLTGRNFTEDDNRDNSPRNTGFFTSFNPLYKYENDTWKIDPEALNPANSDKKWTFASEVTQYNPYGFEVENMDALERYSSAQYGYNSKFPVAVGSNSEYRELGFDGFEDYDFSECDTKAHFNFEEAIIENVITITKEESHTGRNSLRVAPESKAVLTKKLSDCSGASTEEAEQKIKK